MMKTNPNPNSQPSPTNLHFCFESNHIIKQRRSDVHLIGSGGFKEFLLEKFHQFEYLRTTFAFLEQKKSLILRMTGPIYIYI